MHTKRSESDIPKEEYLTQTLMPELQVQVFSYFIRATPCHSIEEFIQQSRHFYKICYPNSNEEDIRFLATKEFKEKFREICAAEFHRYGAKEEKKDEQFSFPFNQKSICPFFNELFAKLPQAWISYFLQTQENNIIKIFLLNANEKENEDLFKSIFSLPYAAFIASSKDTPSSQEKDRQKNDADASLTLLEIFTFNRLELLKNYFGLKPTWQAETVYQLTGKKVDGDEWYADISNSGLRYSAGDGSAGMKLRLGLIWHYIRGVLEAAKDNKIDDTMHYSIFSCALFLIQKGHVFGSIPYETFFQPLDYVLQFIKSLNKRNSLRKDMQRIILSYITAVMKNEPINRYIQNNIELEPGELEVFYNMMTQIIEHITDKKIRKQMTLIFKDHLTEKVKHGLLVEACKKNEKSLVEYCLELGAKIPALTGEQKDDYLHQGTSALQLACHSAGLAIIQTLLKKIPGRKKLGLKYVVEVCERGDPAIIDLFIQYGVDFNRSDHTFRAMDIRKRSPLLALLAYHPGMVDRLMLQGVELSDYEFDEVCKERSLSEWGDNFMPYIFFSINLRNYILKSNLAKKFAYIDRLDEKFLVAFCGRSLAVIFDFNQWGDSPLRKSVENDDVDLFKQAILFQFQRFPDEKKFYQCIFILLLKATSCEKILNYLIETGLNSGYFTNLYVRLPETYISLFLQNANILQSVKLSDLRSKKFEIRSGGDTTWYVKQNLPSQNVASLWRSVEEQDLFTFLLLIESFNVDFYMLRLVDQKIFFDYVMESGNTDMIQALKANVPNVMEEKKRDLASSNKTDKKYAAHKEMHYSVKERRIFSLFPEIEDEKVPADISFESILAENPNLDPADLDVEPDSLFREWLSNN